MISKNLLCDIIKLNMWCHKIEYVMSRIWYFDTTKSIFDITKLILRHHKIMNSQNDELFVDVPKQDLWYQNLEFVISHNRGLIVIAKRHLLILGCLSTDVIVCSNFYRTSATSIASVSTGWRPLMVLMPSPGIVSRIILMNISVCCCRCWMIHAWG